MEPLVMEAISWAFKPTIQSVHPQEPQVLAWRESVASMLTAALFPARQYIAQVQAYCSWLAIDPVAYVEALQVWGFVWYSFAAASYCSIISW